MENTDAKVFLMIQKLSTDAILQFCAEHDIPIFNARRSLFSYYKAGEVTAEEITAAWNDDTWNGKE